MYISCHSIGVDPDDLKHMAIAYTNELDSCLDMTTNWPSMTVKNFCQKDYFGIPLWRVLLKGEYTELRDFSETYPRKIPKL